MTEMSCILYGTLNLSGSRAAQSGEARSCLHLVVQNSCETHPIGASLKTDYLERTFVGANKERASQDAIGRVLRGVWLKYQGFTRYFCSSRPFI